MIFDFGMKILIFLCSVFFAIFWYLCNLWTAPGHIRAGVPPEKRDPLRAAIVSFFVTFRIFFIASLVLIIFSFLFRYFLSLIPLIKP